MEKSPWWKGNHFRTDCGSVKNQLVLKEEGSGTKSRNLYRCDRRKVTVIKGTKFGTLGK